MNNVLREPSARVQRVIRAPGVTRPGSRSTKTVELLDLHPTLTDLAALSHYARNEGKNMAQLLRNSDLATWDKPAFSQVIGGRSVHSGHSGRWRCTEWQGREKGRELYDQQTDPAEKFSLADSPALAGIVARYMRCWQEHL